MASLETIPEIINMARRSGLESVANRLDYLHKLGAEDKDEPMNITTVNMLVSFMIEHPRFTTDIITVSPNGCIYATWDIAPDVTLDAQFLPSGNVQFIYATDGVDSEYFTVLERGEASPNDMLKVVMPLIERTA